jgi:hypothetical protein
LDQSIEIEPFQNMVEVELVKVETLQYFIAPVQVVLERKEVE